MTTYYVASLTLYVLVEAENEADARRLGHAALQERYRGRKFNIRTVRPATHDEIEFQRTHKDMLLTEITAKVVRPLVDPAVQDQTDWTPLSVVPRERADGTVKPTSWYAYNRATRKGVRFASFEEASAFCFHPDNRR